MEECLYCGKEFEGRGNGKSKKNELTYKLKTYKQILFNKGETN